MNTRSLEALRQSRSTGTIDSRRRPFGVASDTSKPGFSIPRSSSPLALFSTFPTETVPGSVNSNLRTSRRRSAIEPILEYEEGIDPEYKARQHTSKGNQLKPTPPPRSKSADFLSITTTKPIYINHPPRYFAFFFIRPRSALISLLNI